MRVQEFLASHPVFRYGDFAAFLTAAGTSNANTQKALLAYHVRAGHIQRIRRGLFAAVPTPPQSASGGGGVDPFLLASHLADDAVIAYHSALQLHGYARTHLTEHQHLTRHRRRAFHFEGWTFIAVQAPKVLRDQPDLGPGIDLQPCRGTSVRVTSLERTLVDLLDAPKLGGGWQEIWRSMESVESLALSEVVTYALFLGSATTVAKVGFFLEQHARRIGVAEHHLAPLRQHAPRQARYLERSARRPGKLVAGWNLVVPRALIERRWSDL